MKGFLGKTESAEHSGCCWRMVRPLLCAWPARSGARRDGHGQQAERGDDRSNWQGGPPTPSATPTTGYWSDRYNEWISFDFQVLCLRSSCRKLPHPFLSPMACAPCTAAARRCSLCGFDRRLNKQSRHMSSKSASTAC